MTYEKPPPLPSKKRGLSPELVKLLLLAPLVPVAGLVILAAGVVVAGMLGFLPDVTPEAPPAPVAAVPASPSVPPAPVSSPPARTSPPERARVVTAPEFGSEWPFTVPNGVLECEIVGRMASGMTLGAVYFTSPAGVRYAVNGTAATRALPNDPIRRPHPEPFLSAEGVMVSITTLLNEGLKLCEG